MKRFTGLNKMTARKIVLDAGAFFVNYDEKKSYTENVAAGNRVGATQGGGSFQANPETRYIKVDGMPENTKGMLEITGWKPTLNCKMLEQDARNVKLALGAAKEEAATIKDAGYKKVTAKDGFDDGDYLNNVAVATRVRGTDLPVIVVVYCGISFGGLTWNFADQSEVVSDVTFNGHYSVGENDEISGPPFAIYIPDNISQEAAAVALGASDDA